MQPYLRPHPPARQETPSFASDKTGGSRIKRQKYEDLQKVVGILPPSNGKFLQIHGSKSKLHPVHYLRQACVSRISHAMLFFGVEGKFSPPFSSVSSSSAAKGFLPWASRSAFPSSIRSSAYRFASTVPVCFITHDHYIIHNGKSPAPAGLFRQSAQSASSGIHHADFLKCPVGILRLRSGSAAQPSLPA